MIDPLVKVFDLRTMRALPPISYPPGPFMLAFHPNLTSTLLIAAQHGIFQFAEVGMTTTMPNVYQVRSQKEHTGKAQVRHVRTHAHAGRFRLRAAVHQMDTGGNAVTCLDISSSGKVRTRNAPPPSPPAPRPLLSCAFERCAHVASRVS